MRILLQRSENRVNGWMVRQNCSIKTSAGTTESINAGLAFRTLGFKFRSEAKRFQWFTPIRSLQKTGGYSPKARELPIWLISCPYSPDSCWNLLRRFGHFRIAGESGTQESNRVLPERGSLGSACFQSEQVPSMRSSQIPLIVRAWLSDGLVSGSKFQTDALTLTPGSWILPGVRGATSIRIIF